MKKIESAAREVYCSIKAIGRNKIEIVDTTFSRSNKKADPGEETIDQIKAYHDYSRMTDTYTPTNPDNIPGKIISTDWCKKLYEWSKPRIEAEKYDPGTDDNLQSYWLQEAYYIDVHALACKRYNNRVLVYNYEYLLNK
jgi:hypothetical protein